MTTYGLAALLLTLGVGIGSWFLYQSTGRGVGWMFVFFVVLAVALNYALTRTAWGRYVFAVVRNAEAARRAGINVKAVYTSVFVLCSTLAALGGILAASRLAASNQATGAGDLNLNAIAAAVMVAPASSAAEVPLSPRCSAWWSSSPSPAVSHC